MARFCGNCGAPLQDVGGFCGQCGTSAVPPQAEVFTAPASQPRDDSGSSAAPPDPVPGAASSPSTPPPIPSSVTPPFSASGPAGNNYAAGLPDGAPASPPLPDFQQVLAPTGKSTATARKSKSGIIVLVIALVVLVLVIVAVSTDHLPNVAFDNHGSISIWKTYQYPVDGFSAAFPSTPKVSSTQVGPLNLRTYVNVVSETTVLFVTVSKGSIAARRDLDEMLKGAENVALQNTNSKLIRDTKTTLGVYHGLEYESEGQGTHMFVRMYVVGNSLYQILVVYPSGSPYADSTRFLDSFKLIERVQN